MKIAATNGLVISFLPPTDPKPDHDLPKFNQFFYVSSSIYAPNLLKILQKMSYRDNNPSKRPTEK